MSLTNYQVYKHTNKVNGKVYIGITKQKAERRWQNGAGYEGMCFGNAIKKYGWDGFTHEIIEGGLDKDTALKEEVRLIAKYKSADSRYGYNISLGGEDVYCKPHYGKDNPRRSAVRRIDPASNEVIRYETIREAADSMGINHRGISKACLGVAKTYKGYIWEYADKEYTKPMRPERGKHPHNHQKKKVKMIDVDGKEFIFDSRISAGEYVGVNGCTISRYISGDRTDASGRGWFICL